MCVRLGALNMHKEGNECVGHVKSTKMIPMNYGELKQQKQQNKQTESLIVIIIM